MAEQIEAERRATEKYKSDLEGKVQRERALAEAEGRIRENRENEDVNRRCQSDTGGARLLLNLNDRCYGLWSLCSSMSSESPRY